jgi:aspartyl-tRNA(Asn)/glutamyl-tRNA(Gln) amidotransferase subunit C
MNKISIDKQTLEHLAELARIEINKEMRDEKGEMREGETKLLNDLQKILGHFEELKEVDTENMEPMAGGTVEKNVFREDKESSKFKVQSLKLIEQFPEKEDGFLKIPPVFE